MDNDERLNLILRDPTIEVVTYDVIKNSVRNRVISKTLYRLRNFWNATSWKPSFDRF